MVTLVPGRGESGSALILVLIAAGVLSALGVGLVMLGSTDAMIATNFRTSGEAFYAADAAAERAIQDLGVVANWSAVLSGTVPATFVDQTLTPTLASNQALDLTALTADLQRESDASASWGLNNPRWRLFAYGPLSQLTGTGGIQSSAYIVSWIADDPAETDGDPMTDGNGTIVLRARALGLFGSTRGLEVTLARTGPGRAGVRILSWRQAQ
ncbi:MAG TPA: hypothetical protein VES67_12055 [Vicinamibacterales bacterium]|nr:hypothetical protein [Vicinamibacterales bacterium]